ncbi:glycosyltransferase [Bacillus sp. AFS041924]|uniref:glycosyltransferase n=1 Tax=Bacillus sp. AFS041924 TaxID=2033503 RepID=UPI0020D28554|nr:glycosyltransferase [Bacillus sp. AFS041924]
MSDNPKKSSDFKLKLKRSLEIDPKNDSPLLMNLKKMVRKSIRTVQLINNGQIGPVLKKKLKGSSNKANTTKERNMSESEKGEYINFLKEHSDTGYYDEVKPIIDKIPESNGSRYYPQINANIGIIADEFLFNSFKGIANFVYITRDNYKEYTNTLDIFIVASAWKGLNNEWKGLANPNNRSLREGIFEIIETYKENGIKCVFYSKEDPVNYNRFIEIAQKADYIFTTAEEVVENYKTDCNNQNVDVMKFGVNPLYHNPVGFKKYRREKEVFFAGSWYLKYPQRQKDSKTIFEGVINADHKLKLVDRNYNLFLEQHFFPKKYVPYISPAINHEDLQKIHKLYDWSLNLNSVKYSPTMFANRVFELQALGNLMLSNYSMSINNKFPNVFIVHDSSEVSHILNGYTQDELYKHQVQGIRKVMSHETTVQRIERLLQFVGFPHQPNERSVAVVVEKKTDKIEEMFEYQTYENKHLITVDEFTETVKAQYDLIAFFHEEKEYYEYYLEDMINGFKYTNSAYVTKDGYYDGDTLVDGVEHDYVTTMKDKYRTIFWAELFSVNNLLEMTGEQAIENGYSIDHFEFNNQVKLAKPQTKQYKFSVIIPAYNNGEYLLNKCFYSLRRSSMFDEMEVIIVDDGSTDSYTPMIINRIARDYPNVTTYFYTDGGSGTASRPRNKGIEMSTTDYITFLDPDNEAVNDGYAKLYEEIVEGDYDFVVGNIYRVSDREVRLNYVSAVKDVNKQQFEIKGNTKQVLVDSSFKAASIQAVLAKKSLITNNQLKMVVGAAGQDTLFFHELLLNATNVKLVKLDIHIYYAAVSGSTVNTITKNFFRKFNILEHERIKALRKYEILDEYLEKRFEYYFKNWYLAKLKKIKETDAIEAIEILCDIWNIYKDEVNPINPDIIRFANYAANKDYEGIYNEYVLADKTDLVNV